MARPRSWKLLLTALTAVALFSALPATARASAGTSIVVESSSVGSAGATGTASVSVLLAPSDSLTEFDVRVSFDPNIVVVEDADAIVLNQRWEPPAGLPLLVDASIPGVVRVHASTGNACPPGTTCPLFSFAWVGGANGSSSMSASVFTLTGTESGEARVLSGVTSVSADVTVGVVTTPTPSPTPMATPTPSATADGGGTVPSPTAVTPPATSSPPGAGTPSPVSTAAGVTATVVRPPALAPGSGTGLAPGDTAWLGQAALAAFVVAALLSFGWITSTLRSPAPADAASTPHSPPIGVPPAAPPAPVQEELRMQAVSEYLKMMEALGLASSDISTGDERPRAGDDGDTPPTT